MTWTQPLGGEPTHHIFLLHFLGEGNSSLIDYESKKFPQDLVQGQKIAIALKPPTKNHWNIALDLILPWILEDYWQQCEANQVTPAQEERSEGAETLPTKMAPNRECVLESTHGILDCIHILYLQTMHELGSMQEMDRDLAQTLMAEFVRLKLIVGEDLTRSLMVLCTDLEAFCAMLMSDIARTMDLHPNDPTSCQVKATLRKFQQTTSLKVTLPLIELEVAREDMETFMWSRLQELSSQTESWELIGELSQKLANHTSRV